MRWPFGRRREQAPNGDDAPDPVAALLAGVGPLTALYREPGVQIDPADLATWVDAEETDNVPPGYQVLISLADECSLLVDAYDDDLEARFTAQPGIDAAMHEDREVIWVRSTLPPERVRAAAVAVLLAAHRDQAARHVERGKNEKQAEH